ncbi:MAG: EAL domain-containing protein [Neomegalonema sp.]|nr:EAL domain-containing protein [Neomegalonema sp.]
MRLVGRFVAPTLIVLAICAVVLYNLRDRFLMAEREAATAAATSAAIMSAASAARAAYGDLVVHDFLGAHHAPGAQRSRGVLRKSLAQIKKLSRSPSLSAAVKDVSKLVLSRRPVRPREAVISAAFGVLQAAAAKQSEDRRTATVRELSHLFNEAITFVGAAILVSMLIYAKIGVQMSRPLRQLLGFADAVAKGDKPPALPTAPLRSDLGRLVTAFSQMLTALQTDRRALERLAYRDPETKLPNRIGFVRDIDKELETASDEKEPALLLLLHFPQLQQLEALFGDDYRRALESAIAKRLQEARSRALREKSNAPLIIGRPRFDVFAVFGSRESALHTSAVRQSFRTPAMVGDNQVLLEPRAAAARGPEHGRTAFELLGAAEVALAGAKQSGATVMYRAEIREEAIAARELEAKLRLAVDRHQLEAFYQPKICCRTGRILGAEALARWRGEDGQLISPALFVPSAERSGLISRIDYLVLRAALEETAKLHAAGFAVSIAVNFSAVTLGDPRLPDIVQAELERAEVPSEALEMEITETALVSDVNGAKARLEPLRAGGVRVALDDFGVGYGSLASLRSLPIDTLKVDRSVLPKDETDSDAIAIAEAVFALAERMKVRTVAEGVETEWQARFISSHGCDVAQGFLFGRPTPADEYAKRLEEDARCWTSAQVAGRMF